MPALEKDGAEHFPRALSKTEMAALHALGEQSDTTHPGRRLHANPLVRQLAGPTSTMAAIAQRFIGPNASATRAVLFDKTPENNWPLGWHQDRTICVKERAEVAGYGPFTTKSGILHVQPPAALMKQMITLRAHLDPCDADNAALKVALGTHLPGRVPASEVQSVVDQTTHLICAADAGDIWAYRTLILHASDASVRPSRRRVLQVDFCATALPKPLAWAGI